MALTIGQFRVATLVLALVRVELSARVQHVRASGPDAVDVVTHFGEAARVEIALFVLHEFLETVARQLLVFDVVTLVLLCNGQKRENLQIVPSNT